MSGPANPSLVKLDFNANHVEELRDFHCGDQPWAMLAAEWIKGPAVWKSINERGSKVWIYTLPTGPIVGFGSLGRTYWTIPTETGGVRQELSYIPMLAVAAEFQGKPEGAESHSRFSGQILRDLIESSRDHGLPLLGLLVHKDNHKALALYERFGFSRLPDLVHGINVAMVRAMT